MDRFLVAQRHHDWWRTWYCFYCLFRNWTSSTVCLLFYQFHLTAISHPYLRMEIQHKDHLCCIHPNLLPIADPTGDTRHHTASRPTIHGLCYIISSSYFVLKDWEKVVYGYVTLYICSFVLDQVVNSARQSVQFFIISDKYEEIGKRINVYPHRGVTVINASGFYTGKEIKMLFILAKKRESGIIFHLIKEIDPNAFVSQSAVIGVYGEGFDRIKGK